MSEFMTVFLADAASVSFLGGWGLYRFVKSPQAQFMTLRALGHMPLPLTGLYGFLAGILIGGRYWWGPRFGAPRPPFAGTGKRRRRKKRQAKPRGSKKAAAKG